MIGFNVQKFDPTRILAMLLCLGIVGQASSAWARFKPKRGIGRPNQRIGLATRGGCAMSENSKPLTLIVPIESGFTATSKPDFMWFMPQHTYPSTEFRLMVETTDGLEIVHREVFDTLPKNQIVRYDLGTDNVAALEPGKAYKWQVHLVCDPDMPSGNIVAGSWVEYETPSALLQQQINRASGAQKANLWLENGYWYEGTQELQLQMQEPSTRDAAAQEWQDLMTDELVDLPHLATLTMPVPEEDEASNAEE